MKEPFCNNDKVKELINSFYDKYLQDETPIRVNFRKILSEYLTNGVLPIKSRILL